MVREMGASEDIKYVQPARTCPKCGTHIEEIEMDPQTMLFSRHQLGAIENT